MGRDPANTSSEISTYQIYSWADKEKFTNINANDYYHTDQPGVNEFIGWFDDSIIYADLDDWKTATGQDADSYSTDPHFTSATNLKPIAGSFLVGENIAAITTDYEGIMRNNPPHIGAYEGAPSVWVGGTSTDWATPGNWDNSLVPVASDNVAISPTATYMPYITTTTASPAVCNTLTIASGAELLIAPGKALTVYGSLTKSANPADLVIESGGSLIHNSNDVAATVKLQITGSSTLTLNKYHFVAIPTQYATPTTNLFSGSYIYKLDPLQQIDPPTNPAYGNWVGLGSSTTTPLLLNQGYMIYYPGNSHEYTFTGNLNNGTFNYSLVGHSGTDVYTYNLVPNPYPSSLVWNTADAAWTKSTGIGGTCYIWNAASGNYTNLASSATSYIPVGQAMMVLAVDEALPTLSVNNNARSHSTQAFYKSGGIENQLTIKATANGYADETVVHFIGEATEGFDLQVDGMKLQGLEDAPQLYTLSADKKFSINNLPLFQDQRNVDLNFETKFTGPVSFTISGIESFDPSINICLKDELTSQTINLRNQQVYSFSHNPENAANRFKLVFGGAYGIGEGENFSGNIWVSGNTIYISASTLAGETAIVEVFNGAGQTVFNKQVILSDETKVFTSLSGVAVIRVTTSKGLIVKKGIFK
jgi:hypothetical protein